MHKPMGVLTLKNYLHHLKADLLDNGSKFYLLEYLFVKSSFLKQMASTPEAWRTTNLTGLGNFTQTDIDSLKFL